MSPRRCPSPGLERRFPAGPAACVSGNCRPSAPHTIMLRDETIYGDTFVLCHTAQAATVIAAYDVWQKLAG